MIYALVCVAVLILVCVLSKMLERSSVPARFAEVIFSNPVRKEIYERVVFYNPRGAGLSQIANDLEIPRQHAKYHLDILQEEGIIYRDGAGRYKPRIRVYLKSYAIPESTAFHFANMAFILYFAVLVVTYLYFPQPEMTWAVLLSALVFGVYHYLDKVSSK